MNNPEIDEWGDTIWTNERGFYHRDDGPAVECANGAQFWYLDGEYHRDNGPAWSYPGHKSKWYWYDEQIV